MYCLYAIDNVGHGKKWYMQEDGFWTNGKFTEDLMRFDSEDAAIDWAWTENPHRIYGAEYYAEEIPEPSYAEPADDYDDWDEYEKDYGPSNPWDAPGMRISDFITGVRMF